MNDKNTIQEQVEELCEVDKLLKWSSQSEQYRIDKDWLAKALTTAEQRGVEKERKRISTLIKIKLTDPKDYAYNHLLDLLDNLKVKKL